MEQIQEGNLGKGSKIPSIRKLSERFKCSKDTVLKALIELKYQNIIYPVEKSGYYVLSGRTIDDSILKTEIDFSNSMPDPELFPYEDFRLYLNQAILRKESELFTYYNNHKGLDVLIDSLHRLLATNQIYSKKENIVVTSGTQQALYILSMLNFPNNKTKILLEQPTYHMMNALVKELQLDYVTIERTNEGIDFTKLEDLFKSKDIKFFYTIPRFHNPLGTFYTNKEKQRLVHLAEKYDVYLIEDDYLADFDRKNTNNPLHFFDSNDYVIYLKSFSKIIFPALRIGCVVLPNRLVEGFTREKMLIDYNSNLISQKALSIYIDSGMFDKHKIQLAHLYFKKANFLDTTLRTLGFERAIQKKTLDTKIVFQLKEEISIEKVKHDLKKFNMKIDFLENNFIEPSQYKYIKIDVRNMELNKIRSNIRNLFSILENTIVPIR